MTVSSGYFKSLLFYIFSYIIENDEKQQIFIHVELLILMSMNWKSFFDTGQRNVWEIGN